MKDTRIPNFVYHSISISRGIEKPLLPICVTKKIAVLAEKV